MPCFDPCGNSHPPPEQTPQLENTASLTPSDFTAARPAFPAKRRDSSENMWRTQTQEYQRAGVKGDLPIQTNKSNRVREVSVGQTCDRNKNGGS